QDEVRALRVVNGVAEFEERLFVPSDEDTRRLRTAVQRPRLNGLGHDGVRSRRGELADLFPLAGEERLGNGHIELQGDLMRVPLAAEPPDQAPGHRGEAEELLQ